MSRITRKRRTAPVAIAATVVAAITLLSGCTSAAPASTNSAGEELQAVTINQAFQTLLYLPLYVAEDQGFFTDEGLDVTVETAGSGNGSFAAVVGGSAGFSITAPVYAPKSIEEGGDGVIIAGVQDSPALFMVGKDGESVQDDPTILAGKKIITSPSPDSSWAVTQLLIEEYEIQGAEIVNVALGNELAAVAAGQADYAVVAEPLASQGIDQLGLHLVYSWPAAGADWNPYAFSSLLSLKRYVADNPEVTQSVANAFQHANQFIYENVDETVAVAQKYFPDLDPATVEQAVKREIEANAYPKDGVVSEAAWSNTVRVETYIGSIPETDAADYSNSVDPTFAEKATEKYSIK